MGTYGTFDVPVNEGSLATFWWNVLRTLINCLLEHTGHCACCPVTEENRSRMICRYSISIISFCTNPLAFVCFICSALFSTAVGIFSASSLSIAPHEHSRASIPYNEFCCFELHADAKTCYFILL